MKRSTKIRLVLLGSVSAGALTACAPGTVVSEPRVTAENVYTNDHYIPGAGYFHAPFRDFYPRRYNEYDSVTRSYYYGGKWHAEPHRSHVNISHPTPEAALLAQKLRTDIPRGGFGSTGSSGSRIYS